MGNPNLAGLPQQATTSALPVGINQPIPSENPLVTLADGSKWLRSGLAVAAGPYAAAAKLDHLKAHIFTRTVSAAFPAGALAIATNGTGTFVAVIDGDTTNVYTSTDHGVTWTARAHNMGGGSAFNAILWNGTRFIAVGNDSSTNIYATTSSDGITWVANTIASVAAQTAKQADIAWNGTALAVICPGNTTSSIYTSPTGLAGSWTPRTNPSGLSNGSRIGGGPLGFLCTNGSSVTRYRSLDNGVTWVDTTLGSNAVLNSKPMVGSNFAAHFIGATQVGYSTDLINFVQANTSMGSVGAQNTLVTPGHGGRWAIPVTLGIAHTTDGINWAVQVESTDSLLYGLHSLSARIPCIGGASIVQAANSGSVQAQYALSTPNASNGVGGSGASGMWRIK